MRVRRGEVVDWYVENGESAVLVEGHVLLLSPLATCLLEVVGDASVSLEVVVEGLVDRFGQPSSGGADALAGEAIGVLAQWGVVVVEPSPDAA